MFRWTGSDLSLSMRTISAATVFSMAALLFLALGATTAGAVENDWQPLVERLVDDGFERAYVESVFSDEEVVYSPEIMARKMNSLVEIKLAARKPSKARQPEVMDRYLNPILIAGAYAFYRDNRGILERIENDFAVPGEILTALMLVETKLGKQVGRHSGVLILASMALSRDFELVRPHINRTDLSPEMMEWLVKRTGQKADWGYRELKSLLTYALQSSRPVQTIPSSMYGAIGKCQFIPSSALHYGVDGTGDGVVDLFDTTDALYSMANYVKLHGWKDDLNYDEQLKVIYRYNHSESYAMTILAVSDKIRKTKEFFEN